MRSPLTGRRIGLLRRRRSSSARLAHQYTMTNKIRISRTRTNNNLKQTETSLARRHRRPDYSTEVSGSMSTNVANMHRLCKYCAFHARVRNWTQPSCVPVNLLDRTERTPQEALADGLKAQRYVRDVKTMHRHRLRTRQIKRLQTLCGQLGGS